MKKVLFTSDMVNDDEHIYCSIPDNRFELYVYPLTGDFLTCVCNIIESFHNVHGPRGVIYIPFIPYNNFLVKSGVDKGMILDDTIEANGMSVQIMIPDILKHYMRATN